MTEKRRLSGQDWACIALMILPLLGAMLMKTLFSPSSEGVDIHGAIIFLQIELPYQPLLITESEINSWAVIIAIVGLCLFLTRNLSVRYPGVRQHIAEWIVEKCEGLVDDSMGAFFRFVTPFICAIMALSAFSSFTAMLGLYAPTSDLNVVAGWALLVAVAITISRASCGPRAYIGTFVDDGPVMALLNIISEFATPVSMAFRHYGNVMSGAVIGVLVTAALTGLTQLLLGWLPGFLGDIPFLRIGLPAMLSIYFDIFSGAIQAYIFAMLTMLYVSGSFPMAVYEKRHPKKAAM
ncbi:MAG: F0F1 ATP synthase subunit A [Clostridia bacterium]|nr:F0F1 ATP synthase subunit A [Clostridia bacterium]